MTAQPAFLPDPEPDLGPFDSAEEVARRSATVTALRPLGVVSVQGSLALDLEPVLDPPSVRATPGRAGGDVVAIGEAAREQVASFVGRYLQVALEVAVGDRPAAQLLRHTEGEVFEDLRRRGLLVARVAGAGGSGRRGAGAVRPVLRGVRTSFLRADALEACARVSYGRRSRAVAARFEIVRERWQCVALEFA